MLRGVAFLAFFLAYATQDSTTLGVFEGNGDVGPSFARRVGRI